MKRLKTFSLLVSLALALLIALSSCAQLFESDADLVYVSAEDLANLQKENAALKKTKAENEYAIENLKASVTELQDKNAQSSEKIAELEEKNAERTEQINALLASVAELEEKNAERKEEISSLQDAIDVLEQQSADSRNEIDSLRGEIAELEAEYAEGEAEIESLKEQIAELEGKDSISGFEILNEIALGALRACVRLTVMTYNVKNLAFGFTQKTDVSYSSGSGVIYAEDDNYYYCLSNNHVVAKGEKTNFEITVSDYVQQTYKAELVFADANYDLSVVRFPKNPEQPLKVLGLSDSGFENGQTVVAMGSPLGQANAVTYGTVTGQGFVQLDESSSADSKVTFAVIKHNAPIDRGSSGGALLNEKLEIVGINFAGVTVGDEFLYACAIPADKVFEFLSQNGLAE